MKTKSELKDGDKIVCRNGLKGKVIMNHEVKPNFIRNIFRYEDGTFNEFEQYNEDLTCCFTSLAELDIVKVK